MAAQKSRRSSDRQIQQAVEDDRSPATRKASDAQRRRAFNIALVLVLATLALAPFAGVQLPKFQAFFPSYQTAVILSYLTTGYLMMGLYQATRTRSLLHLSAGSFFTAGVLVLQLMAFPGAFAESGPLIGGSQTMIWLWFFWHAGPALGILLFAYGELRKPGAATIRHELALLGSFAITATALFATGLLVTSFHDLLPVMDIKGDFSGINSSGLAPGLQVLLLIALGALWLVSGFKKVLHIWLGLSLVALLCDNAITMLGTTRLSVGWYAGRLGALISAFVVPLVYLQEVKRSYVRAASAVDKLTEENADLAVQVDRSRHDPLTQLPGRSLFTERAETLLAACTRAPSGFATLFIDLDGFKEVNDQYGHDRGNEVLVRVAEILRAELRDTDVAGRLGGDEFAICLDVPAELSLAVANKIAGRIVDKIAQIGLGIGASVGISACTESIRQALSEADEAMYESKKSGKNRSTIYCARPKLAFSA
ncbi:sensor domain-containing diguanylate cyclase [Pelomonas sp. SE-A7]|uniref:GGDEF domain-containing protein n=1 Tax=Pelomonas sp. SE-A7 TaxID=3054953 RepID=UPI00259C7D29|nr:sensor domain-containing diguanylate cyclase [Pelomonas sp. SE-A7]MDM4765271.1 sensor domain-containing diguanylate cyclase [Pelomonas sp. SE-A7]